MTWEYWNPTRKTPVCTCRSHGRDSCRVLVRRWQPGWRWRLPEARSKQWISSETAPNPHCASSSQTARTTSVCREPDAFPNETTRTRVSPRCPPGTRPTIGRAFLTTVCFPVFMIQSKAMSPPPTRVGTRRVGRCSSPNCCPDYRKRRIDERLATMPAATIEQMQALQYDVVNIQAREMLPYILPHLPDGEIRERLSDWGLSFPHPQPGSRVVPTAVYQFDHRSFLAHEEAIGWRRILFLCTRGGYSNMIMTLADRVLKNDASVWWHGRQRRELVQRAYEPSGQTTFDYVGRVQLLSILGSLLWKTDGGSLARLGWRATANARLRDDAVSRERLQNGETPTDLRSVLPFHHGHAHVRSVDESAWWTERKPVFEVLISPTSNAGKRANTNASSLVRKASGG